MNASASHSYECRVHMYIYSDSKSEGDVYSQTIMSGTYMIVFGNMKNVIDAYNNLSNVGEWIKHYCHRKAEKLPLDYLRTAVPGYGKRTLP